jgi:hypothetical protein
VRIERRTPGSVRGVRKRTPCKSGAPRRTPTQRDASPSPDDLALTQRCVRLGFELGLSVLDHVIVAQDGYFSLLDAGLLQTGTKDRGAPSRCAKGRAPRPYGVSGKRVALGQVCVTPGVLGSCSLERIAVCLGQHARGDWGLVDAEDAAENDRALVDGARILSCYAIDAARPAMDDNRLWVITELDRSLTTCLLPSEY